MAILLYKLSHKCYSVTLSVTHHNGRVPPHPLPSSRLLETQDLESNCVFTKITLECGMSHLALVTLKKGKYAQGFPEDQSAWRSCLIIQLHMDASRGPCTMPTPAKDYPGEAWTTTKSCAFGRNVTTMQEISMRPCKARLGRP